MVWKIFLFILLAFVSIAGIAFPIVPVPHSWYEFRNTGVKRKCKNNFLSCAHCLAFRNCIFNEYYIQHSVFKKKEPG